MDDVVQSWWEVPAIAHFCYVFRDAFNIFYFEIGELEAAILNIQDPEMCISLEQLILRLLQGCYRKNEVTSYNCEEKLHELFSNNCEDEENPLENNAFDFLSPRSKVEVLLKLCEFRIDADGTLEAIKDIPSEHMQANCIGKDNHNNLYWYFFDERLYKEDPYALAKNSKSTRNWSIVCHNLSDWETLLEKFSKSKHIQDKKLAKEIKEKYLPLLAEVISEKDKFLRKRFLELIPKRNSLRLSKVQAQKKLEKQMVAEAKEYDQRMQEVQMKREAQKKTKQMKDRKKRAEAREKKKTKDQNRRARQLDLMHGADVKDFNPDEDDRRFNSRSRNAQKKTRSYCKNEDSSEEATDDDEENMSQSESENEQSSKRYSSNSEISDCDKESNDSSSVKKVFTSNGDSVSPNRARQNSFGRSSIMHNSYGVSKFNVQGDSKRQKIQVLRYTYDGSPRNKRLKSNKSSNSNGPVTSASTNDARPNYFKESRAYHPLLRQNLNSCSKTTSPQVIRIDFIKPPKPQVLG